MGSQCFDYIRTGVQSAIGFFNRIFDATGMKTEYLIMIYIVGILGLIVSPLIRNGVTGNIIGVSDSVSRPSRPSSPHININTSQKVSSDINFYASKRRKK